jgi:predicted nucleic acid-binding protein
MNKFKSLLLDTNVWIDNYFPHRKNHDAACKFIDNAIRLECNIFYAIGSLKDIFYLSDKYFKYEVRKVKGELNEDDAAAANEMAWGIIRNMNSIATGIAIDTTDIYLADKMKNIHSDFEDNLVLAAASRASVDLLVTQDKQLINHGTCLAKNINDALEIISLLKQ